MFLQTREDGGVVVATVRGGNLDAAAARELRREVTGWLGRGMAVVLDLATVDFADSSGLGVVCRLNEEAGIGRLAVAAGSPRLDWYFARIPSHRLPPRFPSVEAARAEVRPGRRAVPSPIDDSPAPGPDERESPHGD